MSVKLLSDWDSRLIEEAQRSAERYQELKHKLHRCAAENTLMPNEDFAELQFLQQELASNTPRLLSLITYLRG